MYAGAQLPASPYCFSASTGRELVPPQLYKNRKTNSENKSFRKEKPKPIYPAYIKKDSTFLPFLPYQENALGKATDFEKPFDLDNNIFLPSLTNTSSDNIFLTSLSCISRLS